MKYISGHEKVLYEVLNEGGAWTTLELCEKIGFPVRHQPIDLYYTERIRSLIGSLRKKYRLNLLHTLNPWVFDKDGVSEKIEWIGSSASGYTLDKNMVTRAFECRNRSEQSTNVLLNGAPAFFDFKKLAPKAFFAFQIEVKPKLLAANKIVSAKKH